MIVMKEKNMANVRVLFCFIISTEKARNPGCLDRYTSNVPDEKMPIRTVSDFSYVLGRAKKNE